MIVLPIGTFINAGAILAGAIVGMFLGNRLPQRVRLIVFQGLGLCIMVLGIQMTFKTSNPLYVIGSVLIGGIIGEIFCLEDRLLNSGDFLKRMLRSGNARFTEGFLASTLFVCVGSMAIIGPMQEGLTGDRSIMLVKATLDCFAAMAMAAAYGSGVLASAIPLVIYQGSITICAELISPYVSDLIRNELEAVGGVLILGIGINLMEIKQIRLSSLLPAFVVVVVLCLSVPIISQYL